MGLKKTIAIIILIVLVIVCAFLFLGSTSTTIGSNDLGSVEKVTYSYYSDSNVTIAVISGMHARETLHSSVLPAVCKIFALTHHVTIVNYKVSVTDNPQDFNIGRANGESLVHDFVVKDLKSNKSDLVIIGHDHEVGYGEGYYIATPTMDDASVSLASKVTKEIGFNYYTRNKNTVTSSSSITVVDNPIVATGSMVFVYEIPETDNYLTAFFQSYNLIKNSFDKL